LVTRASSWKWARRIAQCLFLLIPESFSWAADAPAIEWPETSRSATISAKYLDSTIAIKITSRDAGAIDGVVWRGKQFVNNEDHGREIQAAAAFSNWHRECFNPTEAGSADDGVGDRSTSRLLSLQIEPLRLTTEVLMAYWYSPADPKKCGFDYGPKDGALSRDIFRKTVTIGAFGLPNVIQFQSTFVIPENRILGGFEAPTGYMPPDFSNFWIYDPVSEKLNAVEGELKYQRRPIVFSTPDGQFAMGLYAPPQVSNAIYSGQRFLDHSMASPTVKWNIFFTKDVVLAGEHNYTSYIVIGTLDDVKFGLRKLYQISASKL
jgi:hypothetical protein